MHSTDLILGSVRKWAKLWASLSVYPYLQVSFRKHKTQRLTHSSVSSDVYWGGTWLQFCLDTNYPEWELSWFSSFSRYYHRNIAWHYYLVLHNIELLAALPNKIQINETKPRMLLEMLWSVFRIINLLLTLQRLSPTYLVMPCYWRWERSVFKNAV
jgi:hypothetical protein